MEEQRWLTHTSPTPHQGAYSTCNNNSDSTLQTEFFKNSYLILFDSWQLYHISLVTWEAGTARPQINFWWWVSTDCSQCMLDNSLKSVWQKKAEHAPLCLLGKLCLSSCKHTPKENVFFLPWRVCVWPKDNNFARWVCCYLPFSTFDQLIRKLQSQCTSLTNHLYTLQTLYSTVQKWCRAHWSCTLRKKSGISVSEVTHWYKFPCSPWQQEQNSNATDSMALKSALALVSQRQTLTMAWIQLTVRRLKFICCTNFAFVNLIQPNWS